MSLKFWFKSQNIIVVFLSKIIWYEKKKCADGYMCEAKRKV